jgi:hypothetical protein
MRDGPLKDAIRKVVAEAVASSNTIGDIWAIFEAATLAAGAGAVQRQECRRAFYSGAAAALELFIAIGDPGFEEDAGARIHSAGAGSVRRRHQGRARMIANTPLHAHLDVCPQCRDHPFAVCAEGARLLTERSAYRTHLRKRLIESEVPATLHTGLIEYFAARRPTGGFLRACLENDLGEAALRADPQNRCCLAEIALFLFSYCPAPAWGSPTAVAEWLASTDPVPEIFE